MKKIKHQNHNKLKSKVLTFLHSIVQSVGSVVEMGYSLIGNTLEIILTPIKNNESLLPIYSEIVHNVLISNTFKQIVNLGQYTVLLTKLNNVHIIRVIFNELCRSCSGEIL